MLNLRLGIWVSNYFHFHNQVKVIDQAVGQHQQPELQGTRWFVFIWRIHVILIMIISKPVHTFQAITWSWLSINLYIHFNQLLWPLSACDASFHADNVLTGMRGIGALRNSLWSNFNQFIVKHYELLLNHFS